MMRPGGGHRWSGGSDDPVYQPPPPSWSPSPSPDPAPRSWSSSDDDDSPSPPPPSYDPGPSYTPPPCTPIPRIKWEADGGYEIVDDRSHCASPDPPVAEPSRPLPREYDSTPGIVRLITNPPVAATLIASIVLVVLLFLRRRKLEREAWEVTLSEFAPAIEPAVPKTTVPTLSDVAEARSDLEALRQDDPHFSVVLFEDFLYALYTAFHEARGGHRAQELAPYLGPEARAALEKEHRADVKNVIVGAMRVVGARHRDRDGARWIGLTVQFESNLTEVTSDGLEQGVYLNDEWVVWRKRSAQTRPPERLTIHECPKCGGALADLKGNTCAYCNEVLTPGSFDWGVETIISQREPRPPVLTGADAFEVGTDLPTVVHRDARSRYDALSARDPQFSWPAFQARVGLIFEKLNDGWSSRDWKVARPFVSDRSFQTQLYWIEEYRRQKLVNKNEGARILDIQMAAVVSDAHYDAITVRVFASGFDHTVDEGGAVVSGSKTEPRRYSEYWTLMRGADVARTSSTASDCPSCGAALDINMAGSCEHCHVKVTSGSFDWVLSRIEQDEAYGG